MISVVRNHIGYIPLYETHYNNIHFKHCEPYVISHGPKTRLNHSVTIVCCIESSGVKLPYSFTTMLNLWHLADLTGFVLYWHPLLLIGNTWNQQGLQKGKHFFPTCKNLKKCKRINNQFYSYIFSLIKYIISTLNANVQFVTQLQLWNLVVFNIKINNILITYT